MPEMTPAQGHNSQVQCCIPETTPEMTSDIQRSQVPLRGASKWWRNGREREAEGYVRSEERQNWRLEGSEEQPDVSSL